MNLADANVMRLAIIWRGKFMDAQATGLEGGRDSNLLRVMVRFISPTGLLCKTG